MMINIVNLVGYVEKQPELRYFESGKVLCKLSIVVESYNEASELTSEVIDLELWNKIAEIAAIYVSQSRLIGITGSLKLSCWKERKTGLFRQETTVLVQKLYLLDSKERQEFSASTGWKSKQSSRQFRTIFDNDEDDYENGYYDEPYDYTDTSMDYGYLEDLDNIYEYFYNPGELE